MKTLPDKFKLPLEECSRLDVADVIRRLGTRKEGLTSKEVEERLKLFGGNSIKSVKKLHVILQFLSNFKNPLIAILLCVALISTVIGRHVDAILIYLIVFLSATLNFFQQYKAEKAADELKKRITIKATVTRGGKTLEIETTDLVVGDIMSLSAGDLISADSRVLSSKDFFVDQSSLTGESFPVEKQSDVLNESGASLTELTNIIFCGSNVVTGTALAVVVKTGKETQFGGIAESLGETTGSNEFTSGINSFSFMVLRLVMFFVLFIFLANSLIKHDVYQSLIFSVAVAVGLTPEFLPMIMFVNMGKSSVRMAKKGAIVKKLTAIPNFGSMDILCTDKTGTLTIGKIRLIKYVDFFGEHSEKVLLKSYLNSFYQTGITNPLDEAILTYKKLDVSNYKKLDEIPFDFFRRRMSVVMQEDGNKVLITKGAPEEIFGICKYYDSGGKHEALDSKAASLLVNQYYSLSNEGYRVVAIAEKDGLAQKKNYEKDEEKDLTLLGFVAFLDPPKEDVKESIARLSELGIDFKILTGDNDLVTQKICKDIGIKVLGVMVGNEMEKITDSALKQRVKETTIFARFSPEDKNRVIDALKANGHVVGYMGDGINDAMSLKNADVGISVDNATDVAKECADIILTQKSLGILKDGVIEGRKSFGNTMKYIMMGMGSNFGNMFSVLGASFFLPYLPMLPVQILLNNFLYDFAQVTIPTDNVDEEFTAKPKKWDMKFIRNFMLVFGPISSLYDYITFIALFYVFRLPAEAFHTGWFMESIATQTLVILIIRTKKIPFIQSRPSKALLISVVATVLVGWILPLTLFGKDMGFTALPLKIVLTLVFIVILYLINVEVAKRFFYRKYRY